MPFKDKQDRICGFLDIDEQDKRKKFQRRYFIVNKSKGLLEWYMDSPSNMGDSATPCGIINIDYITKVDEAKKMKMDYCFVINTPFRPYYVQASNQAEVEQWVEILNDASKITVPPEAMHPQSTSLDVSEYSDIRTTSVNSGDGNTESNDTNFTYRTEIVGNVVVKKKLSEVKKPSFEEPNSPSLNSIESDFKYPVTPDSLSPFQKVFFNANDDKNVMKKGWAVKQGHVRKNWKRRYFILKKDGFAYYKSEHDKGPIRTVPINEILAAKTENGEASRLRDNLLLVVTTDKIYYIQADSPDDMHDWINVFNDAINSHRVTSKKHQVTYHQGFDLESPDDILDEARQVGSGQSQTQHVNRTFPRFATLSVSEDSIGNSSCSTDSLEKVQASDLAPSHKQTKPLKTHRRAESEITVPRSYIVESTPGKQSSDGVTYLAKDINVRPESVDLNHLATDDSIQSQGSPHIIRPNSGSYVATQLDPRVDLRSAVKPSSVKKKKNPGILFALNTMLSKKQDKIQKERMRLKTN